MTPENQQHLNISELLEDIRYVNQTTEAEIQRIGTHIRQLIDEANLTQSVTDFLVDDMSTQLGQLAAKVKLTEKAIQSLQTRQNNKSGPGKSTDKQNKSESGDVRIATIQVSDMVFPANRLAGNRNLLPVEITSNGISYCWSSADPEILFNFSLNRQHKLEMQIHLSALIKPEYSNKLKVFIDGQHIKHRFYLDDPLFVISCVLPVSTSTKRTEVRLLLPGTHSPSELGSGADNRILGLAISEVRFGAPGGGFSYLLKRLRLKK